LTNYDKLISAEPLNILVLIAFLTHYANREQR